jgi:putative transposase
MSRYRRFHAPGATWFFTVNCAERRGNRLLTTPIEALRGVFREVREAHPFEIEAMVVLPEHLHCIWTLPEGDSDFRTRWALIKAGFSRRIAPGEGRSESRIRRGERGIWQRRFWEHLIRDQQDLERHIDYIHYNPVKHGWVERVGDWPFSSFHRFVAQGLYPADWSDAPVGSIEAGE